MLREADQDATARSEGEESTMAACGDSYCGIYCGACSILNHGETGRGDEFIACCASVPEKELACGGCKSDALYAGCRVCKIRECAVTKGIAHCVDCSDHPCTMYRMWKAGAKLLPHLRETSANLDAIRHQGAGAWLAAQEKRWSCPECGAKFSWYAVQCTQCGRGLAAEAHVLSGIRKILCRWLLPMAYRKATATEPRK